MQKATLDRVRNHLDTCRHRPQTIGSHTPCRSDTRARQRTETVIARIQEVPQHDRLLSKLPCQKDITCKPATAHPRLAKRKSRGGSTHFRIFRSHHTRVFGPSDEADSQVDRKEFSSADDRSSPEPLPIGCLWRSGQSEHHLRENQCQHDGSHPTFVSLVQFQYVQLIPFSKSRLETSRA